MRVLLHLSRASALIELLAAKGDLTASQEAKLLIAQGEIDAVIEEVKSELTAAGEFKPADEAGVANVRAVLSKNVEADLGRGPVRRHRATPRRA